MLSAVLATAALLSSAACGAAAPGQITVEGAVVRVNQVGYTVSQRKLAYVLTPQPATDIPFTVLRAHGRIALAAHSRRSCGSWSRRWRGCLVLDVSSLRRPGTYRIRVGSATSPSFRIAAGSSLYAQLAAHAVAFLQAQRDGAGVIAGALYRRPAHLTDASARVYAPPSYRGDQMAGLPLPTGVTVDLAGGWFDAGDYLKFSSTASFVDVMLLFTLREYGASLPAAADMRNEARYGTDWLLHTWDPQRRVLYEQVGIGDGRGDGLLGDHDLWRLPQRDDGYHGRPTRFISHRPVFAANRAGAPVSPNLAGREAAAFALCSQVFRASDPAYADRCLLAGQTLYDDAATRWRGPLAGSVPTAYYLEPQWRDDMELAAIELYLASLLAHAVQIPHPNPYDYLKSASSWADGYMSSRLAGEDSLNLYDVAPLAHYDLYRAMVATGHRTDLYTNASDVLGDLHDQLRLAMKLARTGPLGLADPATPDDTVAHALGYAVEARLYDALTRSRAYEDFAQQQLSWVLGANPWGSSFVVGAGSLFPRCLAHQVANLSGSLSSRGPILTGAVVAGPTGAGDIGSLGAPDGYRRCSARSAAYASFDGHGFRYLDDVRSSSTSEPSDDFVSLSVMAFAQEAGRRLAPAPLPRLH